MNKNEDTYKYENKNPLAKFFIGNFFKSLISILSEISAESIYEAGCGNGYVTEAIKR